jgi:hypothetical protein
MEMRHPVASPPGRMISAPDQAFGRKGGRLVVAVGAANAYVS